MLSIIIVSYNTRELLRRCLQSLAEHSPTAEVVVVDNASRDGSTSMVQLDFPKVKLVVLDTNLGFAGGNNVGLEHTSGDYVLLLNSDTYVEDDTLDRCAAWMDEHPEVGAVTPRLIGFDGTKQITVHPVPSFGNKLRTTFRLDARAIPDGPDVAPGWLPGAALMVRRAAVTQLGLLLDTVYFMYWEDADLCGRLSEKGWKLAVFSDGHVRHLGGASSGGPSGIRAELLAHFLKGKYRWYARHRPTWERPGLWVLDGIETARKYLRGVIYRGKRKAEWRQAGILARVLGGLCMSRTLR